MRLNSLVMGLLAVVFGLVAVFLANVWMSNQRIAVASVPGPTQTATIVVASRALRFGEALTRDNMREIDWPSHAVPEGAFETRDDLLKEGQRHALSPLSVNEPVLNSKITGAGQRPTLSAVLEDGMRAVSIRVNDVLGVAGFVLPGDRVDIMLTRNARNTSGEDRAYVDVLLQSVKVLAIDQLADENRNSPTVVRSVTLEVSTRDAQKLTLAAGVGQLSLALRQSASGGGEDIGRVTIADLTGERTGELIEEIEELTIVQIPADDTITQSVEVESEEDLSVVRSLDRGRSHSSVGVFRNMQRHVYDVPNSR